MVSSVLGPKYMQKANFRRVTSAKARSLPTSGPTVRPDRLPVKKMRPGSTEVSGNKKRRSAHTETLRPGPDVSEMNVFIPRRPSGERGDNFIGSFYTSYSPFTASCLLIAIMQPQELDFLQMTVLSDRQVPLAVWVAQPAKKRRVGSDHRARRQWSSSLKGTDCKYM